MSKIKVKPSVPTNIEIESIKNNHARLNVFPYEKGYAISVAHPLRRLLLSATVGYAPIAVQIEGVKHEFDSVRGMLQDVAEFIINLKNIRFKIKDSEKDQVTVSYSFEGPKELTGADLVSDEIDVVTPENFLATLNEDAKLNFSLIVHKGIGYVPSEEIRQEVPEGYIALDAFFTPVKKALYNIENVLVDDNPNYEKIVFDIETDGQIAPVDALKMALEVLQGQLAIFNAEMTVVESAPTANALLGDNSPLFQKIDVLNLGARSYNSLEKAGIEYVGELAILDQNELKNIKNLGKKSIDEIVARIEEFGIDTSSLTPEDKEAIRAKINKLKG
ncbi:DNA-directed RNA polymerase subunit alpha [Nitratiruptor sp. YY09-18]|uniref:DNA-directed RNA polymerase subunit alpha n=1 Tax=Nitratiruptor sp. YY09-18 TaxID=2724901 RepID=UPI001916A479|nr:DNA-directed RNA polymerase subunit alpha [Nitratiruptor sp. YY09-18]BCD67385.1 DNA-directed RNA polymerase subunit alpha [Nitratiruptor sp. YY09-18]